MATYTEEDVRKMIDECEILILPDNTSMDDLIAYEHNSIKIQNEETQVREQKQISEEEEEDFEALFQATKAKSARKVS